jgi:diguanylate cyclase (GGDEF)-like protein/PAS domain S-box-containing protein
MEAIEDDGKSSLLTFIKTHHAVILDQWERFAGSIPAARKLDSIALRDHALGMLNAIESDLEVAQTPLEQSEKSKGHAPQARQDSPAMLHGADRVLAGFTVTDTISEFRALRASVLALWNPNGELAAALASSELTRFHEAIDQALTESIRRFALDKEEYTRRFDTLLSSSPDFHYIVSANGDILYANVALCRQVGVPQEKFIGARVQDLFPAQAQRILSELVKVVATREPLRAEAQLPGPDGTLVSYRYVLLPVVNSLGRIDAISGTARNISELKASEEVVHRNAYYDGLTQLPNRALFHDRLAQDLKHAARTAHPLALLYIDLDGFKEVNDRSGHAAGDELLKESARRLSACVRSSDTVARIGGDEFTVVLSEINDVLHIEILAQSILDELSKPFAIGESVYFISGSMGITVYPQDGHSADELLGNADQAMYVAKQAGRNRFSFFTAQMRDSAWARLKIIDELRAALSLHQLEVYYQPIVDLASGAIVKAEALLRWQHPQDGLVLPDAFIGLAEQTGLIGEIGSWVFADALEHARLWTALLGRPFQVSVNKSPVEFMNVARMKNWDSDLALLQPGSNQIAVEITEGLLLNDSRAIRDRLALLRSAGVQFTIDDFGIGYSSLSYLKKFKVDFLKIDQSFVKDMLHGADSGVFAETIIVMAHKLGLKVIAEGVETPEQRDLLKAMGCDYAQGFLFSAATPAARFTDMLTAGAP